MIKGIHHVQISVNEGDEKNALKFYEDVMGFQQLSRPQSLNSIQGYWLQSGFHQVHIRTESSCEREQSSNHIAYEVECLADFQQKIENYGLEVKKSIKIPGMDRFEFRDPFGNRIEILELE